MEKKHYVTKKDPYFENNYTREKLIKLVEKLENEDWKL
jgi:hypothetical protein